MAGVKIRSLMRTWSKLTVELEEMERTNRLKATMDDPPRWTDVQLEEKSLEVLSLGMTIQEMLLEYRIEVGSQ